MLKLFVPQKAASHRQKRVAEEIRHILSQLLLREELPVYENEKGLIVKPTVAITITHVNVSPDLSSAQVGVMPLGGANQDIVAEYMNLNASFLRKLLAKKLKTRIVPELRFFLDEHFDNAAKIDALLDKVKREY